jgi:hypothetical protein
VAITTIINGTGGKFATGVIDTVGKFSNNLILRIFTAGVNDLTRGK